MTLNQTIPQTPHQETPAVFSAPMPHSIDAISWQDTKWGVIAVGASLLGLILVAMSCFAA